MPGNTDRNGNDSQEEINNNDNQQVQNIDHGLGLDEKVYRDFVFSLQNNASMGFDVAHALKMQLQARTRALDFYGKVMAFYFVCALYSIYCGIRSLMKSKDSTARIGMNILPYMLPFVSFMIDASVKRVYNVQAKSIYQIIKALLTFYFLCIYVISLSRTPSSAFYWISTIDLLVFPLVITAYWVLLIYGKLQ